MLVFIILLFSVSARAACIETDDDGTNNLSEILRRIVDLEEKLEIQERINEEQNNMIRFLQSGKSNGNDVAEDEKKTFIGIEKDNGNQWMNVGIENKTHPTDDMQVPNMERALLNSNTVPRSFQHLNEKSSKFGSNRIQRRALEGGVAFYSYLSQSEPNPGKHQTIIFDSEITNVGGNYNHHAGIFIAPEDGVYTFSWSIHCYSGSGTKMSTQLVINSNPVGASYCNAEGGFVGQTSGNVVAEISHGDTVYIRTHPGDNIAGQIYSGHDLRSSFSGWRIF